jgi:hypothetical protein
VKQYEFRPGLNPDAVQRHLDAFAADGWTVYAFGVGHNAYFWVVFEREVVGPTG